MSGRGYKRDQQKWIPVLRPIARKTHEARSASGFAAQCRENVSQWSNAAELAARAVLN